MLSAAREKNCHLAAVAAFAAALIRPVEAAAKAAIYVLLKNNYTFYPPLYRPHFQRQKYSARLRRESVGYTNNPAFLRLAGRAP